jgi:Flp pilus assembly protein TadD
MGVSWLTSSTFAAASAFAVVFLLFSSRATFGQASSIKTLEPAPHRPSATEGSSSSPDGLLAQAKLLADKGTPHEAEPLVRQYLGAHPDSADAHFLLGYILFREIQEQAAVRGAATEASYAEKTTERTSGDFKETKAKASLAECTEGAKHHAPSAADLKIVALDYVVLGDYPDADKWLTKMLEWTPNDVEGWYYLGRTKYNENRFDEAVHAFQQCLKLDPQNVKAEDNLGLAYAGLNHVNDAVAAYHSAIEWQKDALTKNPGPFIDLADLLLDQNRSKEAIPYLREAIQIAPQDSKAHELLGKAYARLDEFPQAQAELEKAAELAPQNANLPCMLGPMYRKQGLTEKAELALDRCAFVNGTHSSPEKPRP